MVLDELTRSGLIVQADGDRLIVRPKERITDEVRAFIRDRKADILAELRETASSLPPSAQKELADHPTLPGGGETGLKTQNREQFETVTWESPIFGQLEAPVLSRDFDSFSLIHPLTGETVTLPNEWLVSLEERSAILEHQANLPREEADDQAKREFFGLFRKGGPR